MLTHGDPRLHLIVVTDDLRDEPAGLVARCTAAAQGGATMVLLRLKHADARTVMEVGQQLVTALSIPVLVSERLDVALACGAAGVHLTARSMPVVAVRPHAPAGFLIGGSVSAADDLHAAQPADFVTIGPVFDAGAAGIGLEGFERLARAAGKPAVAIGGITPGSAADLRRVGASGVAAIRAVLAADDPMRAAAALRFSSHQTP
jgi:thiamine-phosphate pyrophosphorylase